MAKKTPDKKTVAGIGAGLAAVGAAAAAGYYFYASKHAKEHRRVVAKWARNMKNEVVRESKRLTKATPREFAKVVDTVAKTYLDVRSIDPRDVKDAAKELKDNWQTVMHEAQASGRTRIAGAKKKMSTRKSAAQKKTAKKKSAKKSS
jgi:hypothetical protein